MNLVQPRAAYGGTLCLFPPSSTPTAGTGAGGDVIPLCPTSQCLLCSQPPPPPEAFPLPPSRAVASPCPLCPAWGHSFLSWAGQGRAGWHTVTVRLQKLLPPLPLPHSLPAMGLPPCLAPFHPTRPLPASHVLGVSEARKEGGTDRGAASGSFIAAGPIPAAPALHPIRPPPHGGFGEGHHPAEGGGYLGGGIRPYLASLRRRWMSGSIWAVGRRGL